MSKRFEYIGIRKPREASRIIVSESKDAASVLLGTIEKETERIIARMEAGISSPTLAQMRRLHLLGGVGQQRALQTEKERDEERKNSRIDTLTELPNRLAFNEAIERYESEIERFRKEEVHATLNIAHIDMDRFGSINKVFNYQAGDLTLQQIALRMRQACKRKTDTVYRMGGDEFAILSFPDEGLHLEELNKRLLHGIRMGGRVGKDMWAREEASRLGTLAEQQSRYESIMQDSTGNVSGSIGWAKYDGSSPVKEALREADENSQKAKKAGGDKYCIEGTLHSVEGKE